MEKRRKRISSMLAASMLAACMFLGSAAQASAEEVSVWGTEAGMQGEAVETEPLEGAKDVSPDQGAALLGKAGVVASGTLKITPWDKENGGYDSSKWGEGEGIWELTEEGVLSIQTEREGRIEASSMPWEGQKEKIVRVEFGEGITAVPEGAFQGCANLTEVLVPPGMLDFYDECFYGCPKLKALVFANGKKKMGSTVWIFHRAKFTDEGNQITVYYPETDTGGENPVHEYNPYDSLKRFVKEIKSFCNYKDGHMQMEHQPVPPVKESLPTGDSKVQAFDSVSRCASCSIAMSREHHVLAAGEEVVGYEYVPYTAATPSKQEILKFISGHPADLNAPVKYQVKPSTKPPYRIGVLSKETRQQLVNLVNQIRFIAGVDANVPYNIENEKYASSAALVMAVGKGLSHFLPRPSELADAQYDELMEDASEGAFNSNLAAGGASLNYDIIRYMDDRTVETVGHRRHILKKALSDTGVAAGQAGYYSATYVDAYMKPDTQAAWPANLTPSNYWDAGAKWSVGWGSDIDRDSISVTMVKDTGEKQNFSTDAKNVTVAYGTVVFPGDTSKKLGKSYTILVKNETKKQVLVYHAGFFANEEGQGPDGKVSIGKCKVTLSKQSYTYDGKKKKPSVKKVVKADGKTLKAGTDYQVSYKNNTNAGTASVTVKGIGNYTGTVKKDFQIKKASPKAKANKASFQTSAVNVKAQTTTIAVTPKKGAKVTYQNVSSAKRKKYIKVDKKGKVTVRKKAPAGQYKIKVTIAKGKNYNKTVRTVKITVKK